MEGEANEFLLGGSEKAGKVKPIKKVYKKNKAEFTVDGLVKESNKLLEKSISYNIQQISLLLYNAIKALRLTKVIGSREGLIERGSLEEAVKDALSKRSSRFMLGVLGQSISVSTDRTLYIAAHYNAADFSMLTDFNSFKHQLDLIQKSFVTRGRPLTCFKED